MFKSTHLDFEDIKVYGKKCAEDKRDAGYNIGDLLNMPFLGGWWKASPHNGEEELERMNLIGNLYEGSILNHYVKNRPPNEIVPNIPRILQSVDKYEEQNKHSFLTIYNKVQEKNVLCVHLRSGDKEVQPLFIQLISQMSRLYDKTILISGIHLDEYFKDNQTKIKYFIQTVNRIMDESKNISVFLAEPDIHIVLMKVARNMLLHMGGFSVIGSIVNTGNLFMTPYMSNTVMRNNWKQLVNKPFTHLPFGEVSKVFVTFGAGGQHFYDATERICKQARSLQIFHRIVNFNEEDLRNDSEFWNKHSHFITNNKRGFGYWLWKPYIIKKVMESLNENDIVLYCDCGNELVVNKKQRLLEMMEIVKTDYIMGSYPGEYHPDNGNLPFLNEIHWTKNDLLVHLGILLDDPLLYTNQIQSNTLLIMKNDTTMQITKTWYDIGCIYRFIDDTPSITPNSELFREHRHDQSILSILLKYYKVFSKTTLETAVDIIRNRSGISRTIM